MRRRLSILTLLLFPVLMLTGQRSLAPQTSQYMFSGQLINPAYSGSREVLSIALTGHKQWIGVEGAPWDVSGAVNFPLFNNNMALGFLLRHEQTPDLASSEGAMDLAGRINFFGRGKISAGIRAYYGMYGDHFDGEVQNINDPNFPGAGGGKVPPVYEYNLGAGLFYYADRMYLGASVPKLLGMARSLKTATSDSLSATGLASYNYLITGGAYIKMGEHTNFKPSFLVSYQKANGVTFDINGSVVLADEALWLGLSYRSTKSLIAIVEFQLRQLKIGLSWDFPFGMSGIRNWGSPEYFMRDDFIKKIYTGKPMFF